MSPRTIAVGSVDPRDVFEAGLQFDSAANAIWGVLKPRIMGNSPVIGEFYAMNVNSAFADELYFKCILLLDGVAPLQTHDLSQLMGQVTSPRREQLIKAYHALYHRSPVPQRLDAELGLPANDDLVAACAAVGDAFVESRYWFQQQPRKFANPGITFTLREAVLDTKPEWAFLALLYLRTTAPTRDTQKSPGAPVDSPPG